MKTIRIMALAVLIVGGSSALLVARTQQAGIRSTDRTTAGMKALGAVYGYVRQSGFPSRLVELVFVRVSQINVCTSCVES